jgi:large subunit ribosomal protein L24
MLTLAAALARPITAPHGARLMTSWRLAALKSRPRRPKPSRTKPELPLHEWLIKKHDVVEVNQGTDEGRRGRVVDRQWRENTLCVEGVNLKTSEEIDPDSASLFNPGFMTKEQPQPLHMSHVSLIDPTTDKRADAVAWRKRDGRMARISLVTRAIIPLPTRPPEDGLRPKQYAETTRRKDVLEVTYVPMPEYSMRRAKQAERQQRLQGPVGGAEVTGGASATSHGSEGRELKSAQ